MLHTFSIFIFLMWRILHIKFIFQAVIFAGVLIFPLGIFFNFICKNSFTSEHQLLSSLLLLVVIKELTEHILWFLIYQTAFWRYCELQIKQKKTKRWRKHQLILIPKVNWNVEWLMRKVREYYFHVTQKKFI